MNKKELSEIKKQFKTDNPKFVINRIANAYISVNGGIRDTKYFKIQNFALMPEIECDFYLQNCKKTLGGQLGKGLVEYTFPTEAYEENGGQKKLYDLLKTRLEDEAEVESYITYLVQSLNYPTNFYITIAHCSYSIPTKDKNDEEQEDYDDGEMYEFLLISINMSSLTDIGLYYNEKEEVVEKKLNTDMQIVKAPCDGILFPVFNDRTTDVNNVLYFTKTPKAPNEDIIMTVLGCEFNLSSEEEQLKFAKILTETLEDDLNYELINNIHENIRDVIKVGELETEMPTLNKNEIKKILERSGVAEEKLEDFDSIYEQELGELELKPVNMIDSNKLGIKIPDITVNVKASASDKVSTQIVNGKKCLVVEIDDSLEVNGLAVNP